jgi:hypothetical protein
VFDRREMARIHEALVRRRAGSQRVEEGCIGGQDGTLFPDGPLDRRDGMNRTKPIVLSFASGLAWATIAYYVVYSVSGTRMSTSHITERLSGGILVSPLIGVLIGLVSRGFSRLGRSGRIAAALADLYLAAFLFLWAAGIDPLRGILLGLTFTGYFLLLWPLSYANHVLIATAWKPAGQPEV